MANSTSCLKTTVKNVSGAKRRFCYLPNGGIELANNETAVYEGDLVTRLSLDKRKFAALNYDLLNAKLDIISTPSPIFLDATLAASKRLVVDNARLYDANPCWASSDAQVPVLDGTTTTTGT